MRARVGTHTYMDGCAYSVATLVMAARGATTAAQRWALAARRHRGRARLDALKHRDREAYAAGRLWVEAVATLIGGNDNA
jgi:hypothetical protein